MIPFLRPTFVILVVALLAGCAGAPVTPADVGSAPSDEPAAAPTVVASTVELGWLAAAGVSTAQGDFVVGIRSDEYCPRASFVVPEGAAGLRINVSRGTGVGPYDIIIENPHGILFTWRPTGEAFAFEEPSPPTGAWLITMAPSFATALQKWTVDVGFEHPSPASKDLVLTKDGQCI